MLDSGNTAWLLTASALVIFMTLPGLALFYGGLVRSRNFLSICTQCFAICSVASVLWFLVGYSLVFGESNGGLIGDLQKFGLRGISSGDFLDSGVPEAIFVLFQMAFAVITPVLVIGAFVERLRFSAVLWLTAIFVLFVYVPAAHWVWGGGWLAEMGVVDFAGGLVVHISAGTAGLVLALCLRSRSGFASKGLRPPHAPGLAAAGAAMLWVGWFGFNAGSAVAANGQAAMAALVTQIAAASAVLTWIVLDVARYGKATLVGAATGAIAGLVAITPASGYVGPFGGLIIGVLGGAFSYGLVVFIKSNLRIDDSLDVFAVHGGSGIAGSLLLVGPGLVSWGGSEVWNVGSQLFVQLVGVVSVIVWTAVVTWIAVKVLSMFFAKGLTVSEEEEVEGLDLAEHGERAYDV